MPRLNRQNRSNKPLSLYAQCTAVAVLVTCSLSFHHLRIDQGLRPRIPEHAPLELRELIQLCWHDDPEVFLYSDPLTHVNSHYPFDRHDQVWTKS